MSRTARDFALQEPDVRPVARMSGPKIPDLNRDELFELWAEIDDLGLKI